jgi:hypothetical protein
MPIYRFYIEQIHEKERGNNRKKKLKLKMGERGQIG